MNFLAHLYLAPQDEEIRLGCFIADAVKGSRHQEYSPKIQEGILLHRREDDYTDNHPAIKESVKVLRPAFRLYASVVIDIYNDHFLAKNWQKYSTTPLSDFAAESYQLIDKYTDILPERMKEIFHY
ncbi:ACP phosphodiesterase, partial [Bacteroidales bacterium OttesenSCG-928-C19]|nr:ACP phosphodiesterase [Bacteroidales bacterium OttesenSCG-928-C19]